MRWKRIEIPLPLSDSTRYAYQCPYCESVCREEYDECPVCKRKMSDDGWHEFSLEYWECECGYHSMVRTEYCPACGRRNGKGDKG